MPVRYTAARTAGSTPATSAKRMAITVWRSTRSTGRPIPSSEAMDSVETSSAGLGVIGSLSTATYLPIAKYGGAASRSSPNRWIPACSGWQIDPWNRSNDAASRLTATAMQSAPLSEPDWRRQHQDQLLARCRQRSESGDETEAEVSAQRTVDRRLTTAVALVVVEGTDEFTEGQSIAPGHLPALRDHVLRHHRAASSRVVDHTSTGC